MKETIGVYDSGLGGVLVLKAIMETYPNYDYIFIGDQKEAPYGDKTKEELLQAAKHIIHHFEAMGIHKIIIGCNTICTTIFPQVEEAFPHLLFYNIIDPTCKQEGFKDMDSVLVMATIATINSHMYKASLEAHHPHLEVYEEACVALVPLIEHNASSSKIQETLHIYLDQYVGKVDAVLLACTHYPLVAEEIKEILPVRVFDSNQAIVQDLNFIHSDDIGKITFCTTLDENLMKEQLKQIFKKDYDVRLLK